MARHLGEMRHNLAHAQFDQCAVTSHPNGMLDLRRLVPIELRHLKGCFGGRVRDALARGVVAEFREVGEFAAPPLPHRFRQLRFKIAEKGERALTGPFLAHKQQRDLG